MRLDFYPTSGVELKFSELLIKLRYAQQKALGPDGARALWE